MTVITFLKAFSGLFREYGTCLEKESRLKGTGFARASIAPKIIFDSLTHPEVANYSIREHIIRLSYDFLRMGSGNIPLDIAIGIFMKKPAIGTINANAGLFDLIRTVPGGVLLHEPTHAWSERSHSHSAHGDQKLAFDDVKATYDFEWAGAKVFAFMMADGFMEEFVERLRGKI